MDLYFIIGLFGLGIIFMFLEVFFLPGTTVAGVIGLVLMAVGVYYMFSNYGTQNGLLALVGMTVLCVGIVLIGFRSGIWKRASIQEVVSGRVKIVEDELFIIGDQGVAFTDIRPSGKGFINDLKIEVHSLTGAFIEKDTPIEIVKVQKNKIFVHPKS